MRCFCQLQTTARVSLQAPANFNSLNTHESDSSRPSKVRHSLQSRMFSLTEKAWLGAMVAGWDVGKYVGTVRSL